MCCGGERQGEGGYLLSGGKSHEGGSDEKLRKGSELIDKNGKRINFASIS